MKNRTTIRLKFYRLTELIGNYSNKCIICGRDVFIREKFTCEYCEKLLVPNNGNTCTRCSAPLTAGGELCATCANHEVYFTRAHTLFLYRGALQRQILRMKFEGAEQLCRSFSFAMAAYCRQKELKYDIITYVPRLKKRTGHNRSELLCAHIFDILKVGEMRTLLAKTTDTQSQKDLRYSQRIKNIRGAFVCAELQACAGKDILLVDDVMTTGATVAECSRILIEAGAKSVCVLALALQLPFSNRT